VRIRPDLLFVSDDGLEIKTSSMFHDLRDASPWTFIHSVPFGAEKSSAARPNETPSRRGAGWRELTDGAGTETHLRLFSFLEKKD
jgi:hypothetical protein